jgi:hypothetical protein
MSFPVRAVSSECWDGGGEVKDRARLIVAVAFRRRLGRERPPPIRRHSQLARTRWPPARHRRRPIRDRWLARLASRNGCSKFLGLVAQVPRIARFQIPGKKRRFVLVDQLPVNLILQPLMFFHGAARRD